ncbi:hypothetical protein VOLCADRAFT_101178, partial [Volvox carteri f. nagariensis]
MHFTSHPCLLCLRLSLIVLSGVLLLFSSEESSSAAAAAAAGPPPRPTPGRDHRGYGCRGHGPRHADLPPHARVRVRAWAYSCPLPGGRSRALTDGSRPKTSTYLNAAVDAPGCTTVAALIQAAPTRANGGFATSCDTIPPRRCQTLLPRAALDDRFLQQPLPPPQQQPPLPPNGQQLLWPARAAATPTSTTTSPGSPSPIPSPSPNSSVSISSTAPAEALRPRRFSAPVIARLLSALRVLVPMVLADLDGVSGSDLSKVVSALAVLRYDNKVVVEQLLQVLSLKLVECSPQLANVLVSLAMLGVPPDPYVRSNIYTAVRYQIRRFMPRDLALTLWAYGAMGTDVQEDAVLVLLEASKPRLAAFSPLHLTKAAQGLAALRYRPPPEWVAAYCEALRPALRRTASRELCAVLLALADLQVTLDDTTRATLLVHTLTSLPSLAPPELALSIWSLGRLTSTGLPALIDLDTSSRGVFSGGELQQLLEGLTRLALQPPLEWMQAYVGALQPKLAALEAHQLAGVLGSLAAQQYRPEPHMQRVVMDATQQNMRQLLADTTATASLITALRRLNIEPPPSWVAALLEASRSALKNRATDLHLANLAGALAAWGVRPDGRWTARLMWRSQVLMQQGRMSPRALVALLQ